LNWLRAAHQTSKWTPSVCTGSLVLAAAEFLKGQRATCHWNSLERLATLGAVPVTEQVVHGGQIVTAAGVSAGIDMALRLAAQVAGEDWAKAIQLSIEYDPQPPFDSGSPAKASAQAVALGLRPEHAPQDASWGERFFHLTDPDGHEISFARLLRPRT
jgi:transcriptional regulator GlxA family with amidase domain